MAAPPPSAGSEKGSSSREGTTKAMVLDQMSQSVQSTSNLLNLMQQTSRAQNELMKLPRNLLAKASTVKVTGQMLEQMPIAISSLDAYTENGLQSLPHLKTVIQLLEHMESCQLSFLSQQEHNSSALPGSGSAAEMVSFETMMNESRALQPQIHRR